MSEPNLLNYNFVVGHRSHPSSLDAKPSHVLDLVLKFDEPRSHRRRISTIRASLAQLGDRPTRFQSCLNILFTKKLIAMGSNSYVKCRYQLLKGFMLRNAEKTAAPKEGPHRCSGKGWYTTVSQFGICIKNLNAYASIGRWLSNKGIILMTYELRFCHRPNPTDASRYSWRKGILTCYSHDELSRIQILLLPMSSSQQNRVWFGE